MFNVKYISKGLPLLQGQHEDKTYLVLISYMTKNTIFIYLFIMTYKIDFEIPIF